MNKKNLIVLIVILLIGVICLTMTRSHEKKKDNIVDCNVFKNNAYKLISLYS